MSNYLTLPVSIGEGLDKLSILEIKLENIKDKRKDNVKKEYDILYEKMKVYLLYPSVDKYYTMLKKTNLHIWDLMDILRDDTNIDDNMFLQVSKDTIIGNDVRFRIKSKINNIINSYIKEEKGYKINRILIDINDYDHDSLNIIIKPLYYFSITYDEVYIFTENNKIKIQLGSEFNNQINILDEYPNEYPNEFSNESSNKINFVKIIKINNEIMRENNYDTLKVFGISSELINKYI